MWMFAWMDAGMGAVSCHCTTGIFRLISRSAQDKNWKNWNHQLLHNECENAKLCTEPYSQQIIQPAVIKVISIWKHFLLKSTTIFRPTIQCSLPNSEKATIALGCPRVVELGPMRMHPPEPCHPLRKPAQPLFWECQSQVCLTHSQNCHSLLLRFAWSLSSMVASGWCALCSAAWDPGSWGHCVFMDLMHGGTCAHSTGTNTWGLELGTGAGTCQSCLCSAGAWLVSGKFSWGSSFCDRSLSVLLPKLKREAELPQGQPEASTGKLLTKGHEERGGCSEMLCSAHGGLCKMVL